MYIFAKDVNALIVSLYELSTYDSIKLLKFISCSYCLFITVIHVHLNLYLCAYGIVLLDKDW